MSNQRFLAMGLLVILGCIGYVVAQAAALIFSAVGVSNSEVFGGLTISTLIGVVAAVGLGVFAWMNDRVQEVGQEVAGELRKVTWPTPPEIRAATIAVVVATLIAAVLLGVMDFLSAKVMSEWIPDGIRWAQGLFA